VNIYPDERRSTRAFIDYDPTITYRQAVNAICGIVGSSSEMTKKSLYDDRKTELFFGFSGWIRYKFYGKLLTPHEEEIGANLMDLLDQDCVPECQVPINNAVVLPPPLTEGLTPHDEDLRSSSSGSVCESETLSKGKGKGKRKVKGKKKSPINSNSPIANLTGDVPPMNEYTEYTRVRRDNMAVTCAQMAKNKFPITQRTEANRLVVRRYIGGLLEEHGLRPQHIRATLDISVSLAFTPDKADLAVIVFESSQAYISRQEAYRRPHTTGWFKNLFTWMPKVIPRQGYDRS
jgi:hypothetical protein